VTVTEAVVSPDDHNKPEPVALKTEFPQLLVTVTTGADGIAIGAATPEPAELVQPPTV
jgi:DNA gyrase/topoisomerase IV subunit A